MVHVNKPQISMIHLKFAIKTRMAIGLKYRISMVFTILNNRKNFNKTTLVNAY
jgi:hypothetical protein